MAGNECSTCKWYGKGCKYASTGKYDSSNCNDYSR